MHSNPPAERAVFGTDLNAALPDGRDSVRIPPASSPSADSRTGPTGVPSLAQLLVARTITVIFRRDPSRDRRDGQVQYEGYHLLWQDGQTAGVGLDSFCRRGQRLLGLDRRLGNRPEALVELQCVALPEREAPLTRIPGCRVRRLLLRRAGPEGRLHFLDGTPTATAFHLDRDESRVLEWIGLPSLADGDGKWIDLAARVLEADGSASTALSDKGTPGGDPGSGIPSLTAKTKAAPEILYPAVRPIPRGVSSP